MTKETNFFPQILTAFLSLLTIGMVSSYDPTRPNQVHSGWAFFDNGAVVPEDTYEVKQAKQNLEHARIQHAQQHAIHAAYRRPAQYDIHQAQHARPAYVPPYYNAPPNNYNYNH